MLPCTPINAVPPNVTFTSPEVIIVNSSTVPLVQFTCQVFSIPPSSVSWTKESTNTALGQDGRTLIQQTTIGNVTTSILTITSPMDPDESNYTCSASNNVQNVLGTPEQVTGTLYVQGNLTLTLFSMAYASVHIQLINTSSYEVQVLTL